MLIRNWWLVIKHAWSIRLIIVAGLLSGAEVMLPLVQDLLPIPRGVFAGMSGLVACGAFMARICAQSKVSGGTDEN
jgi:hypothetical protein